MQHKNGAALIKEFLASIWGEMQGNVVVGLRDKPGPKGELNRFWDFKYPDQLDDVVQFVEEHRNEDVYASPLVYGEMRNEKTGKVRRIPENALYSQTVYQDSDLCPIDKFRLRPSIHLATSSGKYQDFWTLLEPIPATEAAEASRRIAIAHRQDGSDPSSWSANKLLRVPGTVNTNHGFPESVTGEFTGNMYDILDILGAYDDIDTSSVARGVMRIPEGEEIVTPDSLPAYSPTLDKLPDTFGMDVLLKEVPDGTDRSRMRWRMLADLFRLGDLLTFEEVITLAWHAPASRKWREDARNLGGLVAEAYKIQAEIHAELNPNIEPPQPGEVATVTTGAWPSLLSDDERAMVDAYPTFINRYVAWNQDKLGGAFNGPYVRMNAWTVLAAGFSDCGYIPRSNGAEPLNFYFIGIGDSGSGKSSAMKLWEPCMDEIFDTDQGWSVGANASPNALHEKLLERDQKITYFNADEAHGWFKQVNNQQWADGIYENLALYFDGKVPPILRTGNREISGKRASTIFNMHLLGTMKGELSITNVLNKSMFLSGFLARFAWYIGEEKPLTEESMEEDQTASDYVVTGYEPMARQWAAEFTNTKKILRTKHRKQKVAVLMDEPSLRRMRQVKWAAVQMYRDHPQWEIIEPCIRRFGPNIRRAASLLALEEGKDTIELIHTLAAINAAEEWIGNLVTMTERIADSTWSRECDEIDQYIQGRGTRVRLEVVIRKFRSRRTRDLLEQIDSLKMQGRIAEKTEDGAKWLYPNT